MNNRERRHLLKYLILGAAAIPASSRAFFFFGNDEEKEPQNNHQIHRLTGDVFINDQRAKADSIIVPGDKITTGENSEIVFRQKADAYLLRANSNMQLQGESDVVSALRLVSGALLSVFGSGNKQLNTPTATVGIRGTGTYMEVEHNQTYLCTCYGGTEIASATDPSVTDRVATTHHESPRYIRQIGDKSEIVTAPVKNHSDSELILLESTVGREPPFGTDVDEYGLY